MQVTHQLDIRLGGHPPMTGQLDATARSPGQRAGRAAATFTLFVALGAIAFFIPPHVPWAVLALAAGGMLAFRQGRSEYAVRSLTGTCPRCGNELSVAEGEGVRFPLKLTCYQCHHEPVLTIRR